MTSTTTHIIIPREQLRSAALGAALAEFRAGNAPLPLTAGQAQAQALRLRRAGLSYHSIAEVMDLYHGIRRQPDTWSRHCRRAGAPPSPRGAAYGATS